MMLRRLFVTAAFASQFALSVPTTLAEPTRGIIVYDDVRIEVIAEGGG